MEKIKIRMPSLTRDRLESDYQTFYLGDEVPSFNAFVCSILLSMYEKRRVDRQDHVRRICTVLGSKASARKAEEILSSLDSFPIESGEMPFDYALSLRPNKSEEILFEEMNENGLAGASLSSYLRGLLDEYFSLFPCEREKLIHGKEFERVSRAIEESRVIKVGDEDASFEFRPYRICPNSDRSFYYVVGLKGIDGSEVASIHLFKLHSRLIITKERFVVTKQQSQLIHESLSKGAAFLQDNDAEAIVKLDTYGLKYMRRIYHNRPRYEILGQDETEKYTMVKLIGTERQIEYFVLHLTEHAFVVNPQALSERIAHKLEMGFRHYQNEAKKLVREKRKGSGGSQG